MTWLRGRGLTAADSDANFVLFGTFEDRHKVWQALLDRSRADQGDRPGRMAAGDGRDPARR